MKSEAAQLDRRKAERTERRYVICRSKTLTAMGKTAVLFLFNILKNPLFCNNGHGIKPPMSETHLTAKQDAFITQRKGVVTMNPRRLGLALAIALALPVLVRSQAFAPDESSNDGAGILNLSDEQQRTIRPMRYELEKMLISVREQTGLAKLELRQLLDAENPDKADIANSLGKISQLDLQRKTLRLNHWFEVRKVLTPDQREKWNRMMQMRIGGGRSGFRDARREMGPPRDERMRRFLPDRRSE